MDFSDIRLVASDMDGTLLDPHHALSPDFYPVFEALREKGILFAAASGRQFYNLAKVLAPIKDDVIFIAENGSYVSYRGQELLVQALDLPIAQQLLLKIQQIPDVQVVLSGKKTAYVQSTQASFMDQVNLYYENVQVVNSLLDITDDQLLKIAICDLKGAEGNSYTYFQDERAHL